MRFFIRLTWAITCIRTIDALPKPAGAGSNVVPEKHPSPSALQPPSNDHDKNPSGLLVRGQGTALRRPEFSANQNVQIKTKERNMVLSTHDQHSVDISDPSAPGLDRLDDETNFRKSKPPKRRPTGKSIAEVLDAYEINFSQGFDVEPFRWWRNWQFYCRKSLVSLAWPAPFIFELDILLIDIESTEPRLGPVRDGRMVSAEVRGLAE